MNKTDRYFLLGLAVIIFFWIAAGSAITMMLIMAFPALSPFNPSASPLGVFLLSHVSFLSLFAGLVLVMRRLLGSTLKCFITSKASIRYSLALRSGTIWCSILAGLTMLFQLLFPREISLVFNLRNFLLFLPAVLVLTPLQCLSEELLFRSYLWRWSDQRRIFSSPWVLCPLSALVFLAAHLGNPEIASLDTTWPIYGYYLVYGGFLMALTLADKGIEGAVGIHTANNLFALLVLNYEGSALPSASILHEAELRPALSLAALLIAAGVYLLLRRNTSMIDTEDGLRLQ